MLRYREIKRTEGVSTTDLLGRMLQVTGDHAMLARVCEMANVLNYTVASALPNIIDLGDGDNSIAYYCKQVESRNTYGFCCSN